MNFAVMRHCLVPAIAAIALAGCGSDKEGTIATGEGDVAYRMSGDEDANNIQLKGPDGEATVDTGKDLAPDLPAGLAVYPGAKVTNVSNVGLGEQGSGSLVAMDTADGAQKVAEWYKAQGEKSGYKIAAQLQTGKLHMVSGKTDDGREFSVTASDREGGTSVQLIAGSGLGS
ncbi:hypothetical protein EKN06_08035 [Croceicoccus ponticola]|uniref:Lipoprotein n=1 Tax=Croceicoccus ponticola TaxID=2217664 RepID=A0A437GWZ8_9SPHN|nr:hypothetical protein [Croceicoccus ponticola]RVQ66899.1 hypothetical protein EKN06_08035 [Croceicoccus ponticola]